MAVPVTLQGCSLQSLLLNPIISKLFSKCPNPVHSQVCQLVAPTFSSCLCYRTPDLSDSILINNLAVIQPPSASFGHGLFARRSISAVVSGRYPFIPTVRLSVLQTFCLCCTFSVQNVSHNFFGQIRYSTNIGHLV